MRQGIDDLREAYVTLHLTGREFDTSVDSIYRYLAGTLLIQIYDTYIRVKYAFYQHFYFGNFQLLFSYITHGIDHSHVNRSHVLRVDSQNFAKMRQLDTP